MLFIIHIPKTAGTAVSNVLSRAVGHRFLEIQPLEGLDRFVDEYDLDVILRRMPWVKFLSSHYARATTNFGHYEGKLQFATWVREPIACYRSVYLHAKYRKNWFATVEEFLAHTPWHNRQTRFITGGEPDLDHAKDVLRKRFSFVGLSEQLDESMRLLPRFVGGLPPLPPPLRVNTVHPVHAAADGKDWQLRQDEIAAANAVDEALYAYVRDELFPSYRASSPAANGVASKSGSRSASLNARVQKLTRRYYQLRQLSDRGYRIREFGRDEIKN